MKRIKKRNIWNIERWTDKKQSVPFVHLLNHYVHFISPSVSNIYGVSYVWCGSFMRTLVAYFSIILLLLLFYLISWVNASGFSFYFSALGLITTSFFLSLSLSLTLPSLISSFIVIIVVVVVVVFGVHFTTFQSRVSSMFVYHTITSQPHNNFVRILCYIVYESWQSVWFLSTLLDLGLLFFCRAFLFFLLFFSPLLPTSNSSSIPTSFWSPFSSLSLFLSPPISCPCLSIYNFQ